MDGGSGTVRAAAEVDGGTLDCGSGLLLMVTRGIRQVVEGDVLAIRTRERSVLDDLPCCARLAGHQLLGVEEDSPSGPWRLAFRRGASSVFTGGGEVELGTRLWIYTNFDCNLACGYCCAESSPHAVSRRIPVQVAFRAVEEFAALDGREVLLTGGEPFLHPDLGALVTAASRLLPVTILTNAMVFSRGARRTTLDAMDRDRVTLQISLDSGDPQLHDRQRGPGSYARAMEGLRLARQLGFRVRIATTLFEEEPGTVAALHTELDSVGGGIGDRLIRPVAHQGAAPIGVHISTDTVAPEPTLTADGAWWHPVAVTDPNLRVTDSPLPVAEVFAIIRDAMQLQDASAQQGRSVFRCA